MDDLGHLQVPEQILENPREELGFGRQNMPDPPEQSD